jgi:hypothetical protein
MFEGEETTPSEAKLPQMTAAPPSQKLASQSSSSSRYLSKEFWANLCVEIEGLKQTLEQSTDESESDEDGDEPDYQQTSSPEAAGRWQRHSTAPQSPQPPLAAQSLLAGHPDITSSALPAHPPPGQVDFLLRTYFSNV